MKYFIHALSVISTLAAIPTNVARSDPSAVAVTAEVCSTTACVDIEPATALLIIALAQIAKELSKDDPFGENNEIVKAVTTMVNDLKHGPGPNNDAVTIFNNMGNDLKCGPGPNNDVIQFLKSLGVKLKVTGCS
jgi:hypothetical protein